MNRAESRKIVMNIFLGFKSFTSRKRVPESFFSGHASLSSHMMQNFLKQCFLCHFLLNFFDFNNILISMKEDAVHISVNTVNTSGRVLMLVMTACGKFTFNWILIVRTLLLSLPIQLSN